MLLRVHAGPFKQDDDLDEIEPSGAELWSGEVADLTVTALRDAGVSVEPGEWYAFSTFAKLVGAAQPGDNGVPSTVTTDHLGVGKKWHSVIEIDEMTAALMVCRAVIGHIEALNAGSDVWARVE